MLLIGRKKKAGKKDHRGAPEAAVRLSQHTGRCPPKGVPRIVTTGESQFSAA